MGQRFVSLRKITTKRQQTLHTPAWTKLNRYKKNPDLVYYFRTRTRRFWFKNKAAVIKPLRSQGLESISPLALNFLYFKIILLVEPKVAAITSDPSYRNLPVSWRGLFPTFLAGGCLSCLSLTFVSSLFTFWCFVSWSKKMRIFKVKQKKVKILLFQDYIWFKISFLWMLKY